MLKITVEKIRNSVSNSDYYEVRIKDGCLLLHCHHFNTLREVEAFVSGFSCAKSIANNMIQSLPMGYNLIQK